MCSGGRQGGGEGRLAARHGGARRGAPLPPAAAGSGVRCGALRGAPVGPARGPRAGWGGGLGGCLVSRFGCSGSCLNLND